jgi:hypothetical protein
MSDLTSLDAVVRGLRSAERRSSAITYSQHAAVVIAAWIAAVLAVSRLVPVEESRRIAEVGIPGAAVLLVVAWLISRPGAMRLMRTADLRLGLKERLSTAWERRTAGGPLDGSLRSDALLRASHVRLGAAFPLTVRRREAVLFVAFALAALVFGLVPNPMDQVLAQRHADRAAQSRAAGTIAAVQKKLAAASTPAPVDQKVQQILQATQARISAAPDPRTALQNITPAEQQILQLADPQTPARASTAQNLANNLSTTQAGRPAAAAINASPSKGAQALRDLANQLSKLSPQDRAQLAAALAAAANQSQDPTMAAAMQKASSALAQGDGSAAAIALNDLAGQLDSLQQQMTSDQEIASAINGLEAARQQLANQADQDARQAAGTSPSSSSSGSGSSSASGAGATPGSGNGNGTGTGSGSGTGNGGSGGTGGRGSSGSGAGRGSAAQSTERVYVPGQPVPGQSESDPAPLGPGQNVPLTPYAQVIQEYQQAALEVTNQSLIPGSERDLIVQYFSSLGGPNQ